MLTLLSADDWSPLGPMEQIARLEPRRREVEAFFDRPFADETEYGEPGPTRLMLFEVDSSWRFILQCHYALNDGVVDLFGLVSRSFSHQRELFRSASRWQGPLFEAIREVDDWYERIAT